MRNLGYLLAANIIVWVVIFGYVVSLVKKNKGLMKDIESLKEKVFPHEQKRK